MHEVIPGARVEGTVLLDDENIYAAGIDPVVFAGPLGWCSSGQTRFLPCRFGTTWWPV